MSRSRAFLSERHVVTTCRMAMLATGIHWLATSQCAAALVAGVAILLSYLPGWCLSDVVVKRATTAVMTALLTAHIVVGMLGGWYESSALYDKLVHVAGSGAIAGLLLLGTRRWIAGGGVALPPRLLALLVVCATVTLGTLWELFEFTVDLSGVFVAQRGLTDTMLDLLADTMGATALVIMFSVATVVQERVTRDEDA